MEIVNFEVNEVLGKILDKKPYIDRMRVWFDKAPRINIERLKCLTSDNTKALYGPMKYRNKETGEWIENHSWTYELDIHQPTEQALKYLMDKQGDRTILINYLEIALDFITKDRGDAQFLKDFFDVSLIKRWHTSYKIISDETGRELKLTKQKTLQKNGTTYSGRRDVSVNNIIYCDKPSKITGGNCCHLEVRFKSAQTCRRVQFSTFDDLIHMDYSKFWGKYLILKKFKDEKSFKKIIERGIRKSTVWRTLLKEGTTIPQHVEKTFKMTLRYCAVELYDREAISAQNLYDLRWDNRFGKKCLEKIPNGSFLP